MRSNALRRIVLEEMGIPIRKRRISYKISELMDESFDLLRMDEVDLFPGSDYLSELYTPPVGDELEQMIKRRATELNRTKKGKLFDVMPIARKQIEDEIAREKAESDELDAERSAELIARAEYEDHRVKSIPSEPSESPPTPVGTDPKRPSSLMSILAQRAEEERKNKKRGSVTSSETRPTPRPTTSAEPAGVEDRPDKDRESAGIEDSGPRTDTPARSDEKETYEEDGEKVTVDLRAALDYIERFARSRSRMSESRNKKTKF